MFWTGFGGASAGNGSGRSNGVSAGVGTPCICGVLYVGGREFCGKGRTLPCVSKKVLPPTKWEKKHPAVEFQGSVSISTIKM